MKAAATLCLFLGIFFTQVVHAAVTFVGATKKNNKGTNIELTVPGVVAGDVLLAHIAMSQTTDKQGIFYKCADIIPPAGWALLRCDEGAGSDISQAVYWKYAGAADKGQKYRWTLTGTTNTRFAGGMSAYRGADPVNPFDGSSANVEFNNTTLKKGSTFPATAKSITTTADGDYIVAFFAVDYDGGKIIAAPSGMTERYEEHLGGADKSVTAQMSNVAQLTAGATGDKVAMITQSGNYAAPYVTISQLVAIKPSYGIDHLRILHNATGINCNPETITLLACIDASCSSLFQGVVTATLSPSGGAASWGSNPVTFSGGMFSTTLKYTDAGTISLAASAISPLPAATPNYRCFVGGTETCDMTYSAAGFVFNVPDLTACKTSASVTVAALKGTQVCSAAMSGPQSVNFWSSYGNPTTGSMAVSVNGTPVGSASPGTPVNLIFNNQGEASITVNYPDAGNMLLTADYNAGGLNVTGSDSFVSVPDRLLVYSTADCAAGDASCPVFKKAGAPFPLNVKAACWQASPGGDPSLVPATPNFELANISLSPTVVSPVGGSDGALGTATFDMVLADKGVHRIADQTQSEVGVFTFTAMPPAGSYFGLTVAGGVSASMGRFTPDHYALDDTFTPVLTNRSDRASCLDSFTYLDESFRLDFALLARNAEGGTTSNYDSSLGGYTRLDLTQAASFGYAASTSALNLTSRLDLTQAAGGSWSAGAGVVNATLKLRRGAAPDGPFLATMIGIAPSDGDGVTFLNTDFNQDADINGSLDHALLGTTNFRYGRLRLDNAYGSERLALPVKISLQHWNQTAFVGSNDDSCSSIQASDIALSFPVSAGNQLAACETSSMVTAPLNLRLGAPGPGNGGWTDVTLNLGAGAVGNACVNGVSQAATTSNMPYLMWNWLGGGSANPVARASFGLYKSPLIYQRENY
ncbi:MAG: hypothetical protein OEW36_05975 [Hylemonella sp.]|nr:hypothetical protein [Hylemonella sp.]